jgi:ubiquinone/menaquinone biosynthesis C-methylase UbiE
MDEIKKYYINGEHYDWVVHPRRLERIFHHRRERASVKMIRSFDNGPMVLDAGCGTGLITRHLDGAVIGLDINGWNLAQAREHAPQASFIIGDMENLPLADEKIDLVVCSETLEHLLQPQHAIAEFARVLRPGGRLIGSVPHRHPVWYLRKYMLTTCPITEPFHHHYKISEVKSMLASFKVVSLFTSVLGLSIFFVAEKPP